MKLSPASWHRHVPRDLRDNLKFRNELLLAAEKDRAVRAELIRMCRDDLLFYICVFAYQFNPERRGIDAVLPFITFPFQEDALLARPETHAHLAPYDRGILWCYENDKTMVVEKSRKMGASWLFLIFQDWLCLFHEFVQTLNISRNEAAVDDGTKNSLFWKLRYMHERLPEWLHGGVEQSKLYFHFKRTDSEATGEASTKKAGVGGRASVIFVDEFPEIEGAQEIREKTALTASCRYFNGTHLGVGTPFQRMCDPRQSPEIIRLRMHWSDHPEQNVGLYQFDPEKPGIPKILDTNYAFPADYKFILDGTPTGGPRPGVRAPYYDRKCSEIGDSRAVAMNLDISPEGAAKQFFDGLKIRNLITDVSRPPVWTGELVYDKRGKFEGIHECDGGRLRLWVRPKADGTFPAGRYCVGADIAAGTGATSSCAAGIDGSASLKVLEYANPFIVESEFAALVVALCHFLHDGFGGPAYLAWDSSGQQGEKFNNAVMELGFRNVYYNDDDLIKIHASQGPRKPGMYMSNQQKYRVLVDYRQALYEHRLTDRSKECLEETLLFEYDRKSNAVQHAGEVRTNDPSGARKNHGDMVIATSIAWMLAKEMAEGGRKSERVLSGAHEPGTLGWLMALDEGRRRRDDAWL